MSMPVNFSTITFFAIATGKYEIFALPFIAAAMIRQNSARCEVLVANLAKFWHDNAEALFRLQHMFVDDWCIRGVPRCYQAWRGVPRDKRILKYPSRHPTGSIRWLEKPRLKSEFVYICDVDILNTDPDMIENHWRRMQLLNLPYSNIVRQASEHGDQERMSGCHFAMFRPWYDATENLRASLTAEITAATKEEGAPLHYDERLLYHIADRSFGLPPEQYRGKYAMRPIHGLHLSLTRDPNDRLGWNINEKTVAGFRKLQADKRWKELAPHFAPEFHALLERMEEAAK